MSVGRLPMAASMASLVRFNSDLTASSLILAKLGCDQLWLPISCPSATARLRIAGYSLAFWPTTKNVAWMPLALRVSSSRGVSAKCGPSSKVSAT